MEEMNNVETMNEVTTEETKQEKKGFGLGKVVLGAALAGVAYAGYKLFKSHKAQTEEPEDTSEVSVEEPDQSVDVPTENVSAEEE